MLLKQKNDHIVKEQFVGFVPTHETTGEHLTSLLQSKLTSLGLIDQCIMVGQGYDGAANMSGHIKGVQTNMRNKHHPNAEYIHCHSHNLNLALCSSCSIPMVRNMYDIAQKILHFIKSSPKRLQLYKEKSATKRLQSFCPTR